ncbi:MAG: glycosyltransferase family 87 protein [Candidatus Sumerlaeia bacterium]|nr:glycosyltransferase family 87 protein [Candidatus Sumerlaeia bacterium]
MPALLLAVAALLYLQRQVLPLLGDRGTGVAGLASHANDFKHLYLGAFLLRNDVSPFDEVAIRSQAAERSLAEDPRFRTILPYVYLPFTGVVLSPLTRLGFADAVVAWQLANHLMLLGALALLAAGALPGDRLPLFGVLLLMASLDGALFRQNNAGQLNVVLLFGYALVWRLLSAGAPAWALGTAAAFFALFKLSPGILFAWLLLRGKSLAAVWMAGAGAALLLLSLLFARAGFYLEFLPQLEAMRYGRSTWEHLGMTFWRDPYNQSINALLHRTLVPFEGSGITPWAALPPGAANALTWLASIAVIALLLRAGRRSPAEAPPFAAAVAASLLLPSLMWDHYLVQLYAAGAVLWIGRGDSGSPRWLPWTLSLAWVVSAVPVALDAEPLRSGPGVALMSVKLLPPVAIFGAAVLLSRRGQADSLTPANPAAHSAP